MIQKIQNAAGLLAVDIDGTLITDHGTITDSVYRALEKAVTVNWELVIASGRTYYAAKGIIDQLPYLRYAVMSNGSCIMDMREKRMLRMQTLPRDVAHEVIRIVRSHGAIPAIYDTEVENQQVYYDTLEGSCEYFEWYVREDPRCRMIDDITSYDGEILQIGTIAEKDIIFGIRDAVDGDMARVVALPFESPFFGGKNQDYWFLQVVGIDATKHNALRYLSERLEIPRGRLIAVGDNYNDAGMITHADIGVAMGNAPDEIKKIAQLVVGSNNHSGLSDVVEEVILSGKYFPESD